MYDILTLKSILHVLETLTETHLDEVGSVEGPWLNFPEIPVMNGSTVLGKIGYESEIGWYYIPIEAYKEDE